MRRPQQWQQAKRNRAPKAAPEQTLPPRTFSFSPRSDVDAFVKIFSGDMRPTRKREPQ